ncbi:uncharacterized protein BX664DRAFT_282662, partial [Halteromyces radiatus]|uniref:uncharacterized protein n=1 Tax=Halteromyces radiatus TaxID=101107 RepID=UPI0022201A7B
MTTIIYKDLPPLRLDQEDVPDFTEFNLDPFQLHGTAHLLIPHGHREATRIFSLRLQPRPGTQLATSLKRFQDQSYFECGPNQAHQCLPHLSLLGKIAIDCGANYSTRWQAVDVLINMVDEEINKALLAATTSRQLPPLPTFGGYCINNKPTRSVSMRVAVPRLYTELAHILQNNLKQDITSTTIQRIPLAYNVLRSISSDDAHCIRSLANDLINVKKWVNGKESSWELALQEIMLESQDVGKTQQVTTIKTWSLH